jgi:hypothetical protein
MSTRNTTIPMKLERLSGSAYVEIPGAVTTPFGLGSVEKVEVTGKDDATAGYRRYLSTWKVPPTLQFTFRWDPSDTQHLWLETNQGGTAQSFKLTVVSGVAYTFTAIIGEISAPGGLSDALDVNVTLEVAGAVTRAA